MGFHLLEVSFGAVRTKEQDNKDNCIICQSHFFQDELTRGINDTLPLTEEWKHFEFSFPDNIIIVETKIETRKGLKINRFSFQKSEFNHYWD